MLRRPGIIAGSDRTSRGGAPLARSGAGHPPEVDGRTPRLRGPPGGPGRELSLDGGGPPGPRAVKRGAPQAFQRPGAARTHGTRARNPVRSGPNRGAVRAAFGAPGPRIAGRPRDVGAAPGPEPRVSLPLGLGERSQPRPS